MDTVAADLMARAGDGGASRELTAAHGAELLGFRTIDVAASARRR
ncbi:hypothetical protein [Dactylosporangium vinaceum]|uniref:Uncharacterized protein n=1 Tax=Dactylosporangium vinaceum TaxID=53362 RepID=A0ABV5M9C7_9ACTN|nr:hypothetical protein [Dactylosporangium vinaceum]